MNLSNGHSRLSPSAASRWMTCPGSVRLTEHLPRTSSEYAAEGTAAHELAEWCLRKQVDAITYLGEFIAADGFEFEVTEEMCQHVQVYVDLVRELAEGNDVHIEHRVDLSKWYGEEGGGTADCLIHDPVEKVLFVIDLKYGRGEQVSADTPQLAVYGLIGIDLGVERVVTIIVQPRISHIDRHEYTIDEIKDFAQRVSAAAAATRDPDAPLVASEKGCRWCGVKGSCRARAEYALANTVSAFPIATVDDYAPVRADDLSQPHTLTDAELGMVASKVDMISDWLKSVADEVYKRMMAGNEVPGLKLVEGKRGNKAWVDEDTAATAMLDAGLEVEDIYKASLISPSQAEKIMGKDGIRHLAPLISQSAGKPTVVSADDKRPALASSSVFQAV